MDIFCRKEDHTGFNALESLAKSQIPNNIKTQKRKSHDNVNPARSILTNPLYKSVDILRYEILLLYQGALREGMSERFAHQSMDLWVTFADDGTTAICKTPPVIEFTLYKSLVALSQIVYVFPGLCCVERQLVRRDPNDGT
ncbi:MAG: hypothetical protein L6R38_004993 [Xanthoria sp. 2 TBL-2021]|nr:MAG: hypothetical protein L6R38_004993 [Xanthoria sp. 2 TBL-2021]